MARNTAKQPAFTHSRENTLLGRSLTSRYYGVITGLGTLRLFLATLVVLCLPMVFFTTGETQGWRALPSYIVPALVVLLVWGLLFDMLMARVLMGEQQGKTRQRYRNILLVDAVLLVALLSFWGPFYVSLLS